MNEQMTHSEELLHDRIKRLEAEVAQLRGDIDSLQRDLQESNVKQARMLGFLQGRAAGAWGKPPLM